MPRTPPSSTSPPSSPTDKPAPVGDAGPGLPPEVAPEVAPELAPEVPAVLPFPSSLCHRCAAPPRYITSAKGSVFILCPLLPGKYPPQPVRTCQLFRPRT